MKITIKNLRINARLSEETNCFSADVYADGKKICEASNYGHGGPNMYRWASPAAEKMIADFIKTLPPIEYEGGSFAADFDCYLDGIIADADLEKKAKALCKKHTVFLLNDTPKGEFHYLKNAPYSPATKAHLEKKYGGNLKEIVNARYA